MGKISEQEAYARFKTQGRNSSHFVWFLTALEFFETSQGYIFAYRARNGVVLFPLEPLGPSAEWDFAQLRDAWAEVEAFLRPRISFFISVYGGFAQWLRDESFQCMPVGKEPYVMLSQCIPTGKSGKGVRAARNQALRAGVEVREISPAELEAQGELRQEMAKVLHQWQARKLLDLGGFLNTVDPFRHPELRRYFVARSACGKLEGFIVATPIPGDNSYFLEDLVLRPGVARGAGELLTLEAMAALAESGRAYASLGVVSLTSIGKENAKELPPVAGFALVTLPRFLSRFYNVGGLETFRKRFKPHRWETIFLALRNHPGSGVGDSAAWFRALYEMLRCFTPRLNFSWRLPWNAVRHAFTKHPVSWTVCIAATLSFWRVNHWGHLPEPVLLRYGFSGSSPFREWIFRSIASDFLFFDIYHYASSVVLLFVILRWMERSYPVRFVALVIACTCVFDDLLNEAFLMVPYRFFQPQLAARLLSLKDVGPSLWVAMGLGLQLCTLRRYREIAFSVLSIGIILAFAFSAPHLSTLILNLNHSLFFAIGFILGKLRFEYERKVSRQVARQKPPSAKSVAPPAKGGGPKPVPAAPEKR